MRMSRRLVSNGDEILILYDHGYSNDAVTGGWQGRGWRASWAKPQDLAVAPTITIGSTTIKASLPAQNKDAQGVLETVKDIDLTHYSKLTVVFKRVYNKGSWASIGIAVGDRTAEQMSYSGWREVAAHRADEGDDSNSVTELVEATFTLDTTNINQKCNIFIALITPVSTGLTEVEIAQVYLE